MIIVKRKVKNGIWIFPALFIVILVVYIPLLQGAFYIFTDYDGLSSSYGWIGIENITRLVKDAEFWYSLIRTFGYAVLSVTFINFCAVLFARMLYGIKILRNALRVMLLMPNMIGGLILGFMWQYIFGTLLSGISVNGYQIVWLGDGTSALLATVIVFSWQYTGYFTMIYLTGLLNIPIEFLEAARLEGCNERTLFWKLKVKLIKGEICLSLLLSFIISFKTYDINLALTNGGPYGKTELLALNIYNEAYTYCNFSYAQTKAVVFMLILCGGIALWQRGKE